MWLMKFRTLGLGVKTHLLSPLNPQLEFTMYIFNLKRKCNTMINLLNY